MTDSSSDTDSQSDSESTSDSGFIDDEGSEYSSSDSVDGMENYRQAKIEVNLGQIN